MAGERHAWPLVVDASPERLRGSVAVLRHAFGPASVRGTTEPEDAAGWIACERPSVLVTSADTLARARPWSRSCAVAGDPCPWC